jgi:hypothetical protein
MRILLVTALGLTLGQLLVVRSSGHLSIEPLAFADRIPGGDMMWSLGWLSLPLLISVLACVALWKSDDLTRDVAGFHILLLPIVGLAGLGLLEHPGKSQLIFWMTTIPYFAIGLAFLFARWLQQAMQDERAIVLVGLLLSWAMPMSMSGASEGRKFTVSIVTALATLTLIAALSYLRRNSWTRRKGANVICSLPVLFFACLNLGIDPGLDNDTGPSAGGQAAVHEDHRDSYRWLRDNSPVESRFITNKHCIGGSLLLNDCYPRWFMASAISERRSPVEGFSYTWRNTDGPYWNLPKLTSYDEFINAPTENGADRLVRDGVNWIVIDRTMPYSEELRQVGTVVFERERALVVKLPLDN